MSEPSSRRLKIAVLIRSFVTTGGAERYAVEVTRRLAKEHDISVLCQIWDPNLTEGLKVVKIPRISAKPRWLNQVLFALGCSRAVKKIGFDVIHSHERTYDFDALVVHCPCYKTKFVERGKRGLWVYRLRQFVSLRHAAYAWLERQQFKAHPTRKVVVVSDYVSRNIAACYPEGGHQFVVAAPGVEMPNQKCLIMQNDQRFEVLFVGTEFKRKGLEYAIRGFANAKLSHARLRIAGGGDIESYKALALELGIESQVEFLGLVKDVGELYASSHVFLFPTMIEPFGMAPLEAMSYGLPVVVSGPDYNGFVEQLNEGEAWVLEDPTDACEIAQALKQCSVQEHWRELSERSLKAAVRLNWDGTTAQHDKALLMSRDSV